MQDHTRESAHSAPSRDPGARKGTAMTDAEIIAIRDAHLPSQGEPFDCIVFARDIIAEEREACAKACETLRGYPVNGMHQEAATWCAAAIRARGRG